MRYYSPFCVQSKFILIHSDSKTQVLVAPHLNDSRKAGRFSIKMNFQVNLFYVANAAGTSAEMIQLHYYNGENQQNHDRLTEAFIKAAE